MGLIKLGKLVHLAKDVDKKQLSELRKLTHEILWNTFECKKRRYNVNNTGKILGVTLESVIRKLMNNYTEGHWSQNINNLVSHEQENMNRLESRLSLASKIIQTVETQGLFEIIMVNKQRSLDEAIGHIFSKYGIPMDT